MLTKLVPLGGESLAVSAPRRIVFHEDILGLISDDLLPLGADDDLDGTVVGLRDGLGLAVGVQGAALEVSDELGDLIGIKGVDVTFEHVFLEVCAGLNNADGGHVGGGDTEELSETFLDAGGDSGGREEDLALVCVGSLVEDLLEGGFLVVGEKENGSLSVLEDRLDVVLTELEDGGDGVGQGPGLEFLVLKLAGVGDLGLIEVTLDSDTGGSDTEVSGALSSSVEESELLKIGALSGAHEFIESSTFVGSEVDKVQGGGCLVGEGGALDGIRGGAGLLHDPLDDIVGDTSTVVLSVFAINKPFESRESLDREAFAESFLFGRVNLSDVARGVSSGKDRRSRFVFGCEFLAVSTISIHAKLECFSNQAS